MGNHAHYDFRKEEEEKAKKQRESELVLINEKAIGSWLDKIQEKIEKRGYNVYAGLYQIAEKIIQNRKDKTDETLKDEMMMALYKWCEANQKRFNDWHKKFALECLEKKLNATQP